MAKKILDAERDEPRAIGVRTGGRLARKYEYLVFYLLAITSWSCMIASAVLGSLYGGDDKTFIPTVATFLACHWYVPLNAET